MAEQGKLPPGAATLGSLAHFNAKPVQGLLDDLRSANDAAAAVVSAQQRDEGKRWTAAERTMVHG